VNGEVVNSEMEKTEMKRKPKRIGRRSFFYFSPSHRFFIFLFTISLFHCSAAPLWAGKRILKQGQTAAAFLKVPVSARAVGVGEAFVGFGDDVSVLQYNPAGIAALPSFHMTMSHALYFQETALSSLEAAVPWGRSALGVTYRQFVADDDARDVTGRRDGDIEHKDMAVGLAYSRRFGRRGAVGVAVKNAARKIDRSGSATVRTDFSVEQSVWMGDAGLFLALPSRGTLGFAVQNIGSGAAFEYSGDVAGSPFGPKTTGAREALPLVVRLGGLHPVGRFGFAWEADLPRDNRVIAAVGAEYPVTKFFSLRGGFRYQRYIDFSLGLGVSKSFFSVDYAFSPRVDLGTLHRATVGIRF